MTNFTITIQKIIFQHRSLMSMTNYILILIVNLFEYFSAITESIILKYVSRIGQVEGSVFLLLRLLSQ